MSSLDNLHRHTDAQWDQGVVLVQSEHSPASAELMASWERSRVAGVSPSLRSAPIDFDEDALLEARQRIEWLSLAQEVLAPHVAMVQDSGNVLTLFDARGRMLASAGDPWTLARLEDIHFIPGSNWAEEIAGTNGPGTALATGRAVHVVGAEHFCEAWHGWHCAAVPLRLPGGTIIGALDVSGERFKATPWALQAAQLLSGLVEQSLSARVQHLQVLVMTRFADLVVRYPTDGLIAIDSTGAVITANTLARARGLPERLPLRDGCQGLDPRHGLSWLSEATVFPVTDGSLKAGACVLVREARSRPSGARKVSTTRYTFSDLVGRDLMLTQAISTARSAAVTNLPVLVLGESGVGKEVLAQAIHAASARHTGPFVAVNCAALSRELVESELFGYAPGAFSGARAEGQAGKFEHAHCGTIFLDEIGELPLPAQAALLRVLQEGEVAQVGGALPRRVDVRVVAATNRPLEEAIRQGRFRLDLFHRLNVISVTLPPLRERTADLPQLIEHLRPQVERETGFLLQLTPEVVRAFATHPWPGNVRELENLLKRLVVISQGGPVLLEHLPWKPAGPLVSDTDAHAAHLMEVVRSSRNMTEAAAVLGVTRSTLYRQLERLNLKPGRMVVRGS